MKAGSPAVSRLFSNGKGGGRSPRLLRVEYRLLHLNTFPRTPAAPDTAVSQNGLPWSDTQRPLQALHQRVLGGTKELTGRQRDEGVPGDPDEEANLPPPVPFLTLANPDRV